MKLFKKTIVTLATAAVMTVSGSAHAFLQNWILDTNGGAAGGAVTVGEYLDLTGTAYVNNTFSDPSNFTFKEAGAFQSFTADSLNPLPNFIHAGFVGTGAGSLAPSGGSLTFSPGGTLSVFDVTNTLIGTFNLVSGSANLLPSSVLPNGTVSLALKATFLKSGYFFAEGGTDLSTILSSLDVFGFATTNASLITAPASIATALSADGPLYAAAFGSAPVLTNYGHDNLVISNNGQFRLEVPEPASLALAGIALLGLGVSRRRSAK